jgi:YYY domain-containing protein
MIEAITWWLAVELIGLAAFPLAFVFFRFLPDRGYTFSKVLGLLLLGYALWIGGMAGIIPNSRWSIILILALMAGASLLVVSRHRDEVVSFVKARRSLILFAEALFSAAFFIALFLRSYSPDISWNLAENHMDFAFVNAILRSEHFPPKDPWLSGHSLSYYYFGHLVAATLIKLVAVPSRIGYNVALASVAALAVSGAFGLVYNLIAAAGALRRALIFGFLAAVFLVVLSNLVGLFYLLAAHNIGSERFYGMVDIAGLDGPTGSTKWFPTGWWWPLGAPSFAYGGPDRPFPFYEFLVGDLHSALYVLPFALMAMAIALNLWLSPEPLSGGFWRAHPLLLALAGLAIGVLAFTHAWEVLTLLFLLAVLVLGRNYLSGGRLGLSAMLHTVAFVVPMVALAVIFFLPFYLTFHPAGGGIRLLEIATNTSWLPREAWLTQPHHLLYMWLPFLWLTGSLAVVCLKGWQPRRSTVLVAVMASLAPLLLWAAALGIRRGPVGFVKEVGERSFDWVTLLILLTLLVLVILALARRTALVRQEQGDQGAVFALTVAGIAILLLIGPELFWVHDPYSTRFNTVARLGSQAWTLFSISGAFAIYYIASQWRPQKAKAMLGRFGWGAITAIVLLTGLVYPVTATFWRTNDFNNHRDLNGLALVRSFERPEYDAILWLWDNVKGTPVILEAVGAEFTPAGRISSRTGLPTVLAWPGLGHEYLWHGSWEPQGGKANSGGWCPSVRCLDVERAYRTTDVVEARAVLEQYEVEYVYVGPLERQQYGEVTTAKFAYFMDVAYQNEGVIIYRMPEEGPSVQAP